VIAFGYVNETRYLMLLAFWFGCACVRLWLAAAGTPVFDLSHHMRCE